MNFLLFCCVLNSMAAAQPPMRAIPTYHVQEVDDSDRLVYTAREPWPDPSRAHLRSVIPQEYASSPVHYDNEGRPCDVHHVISEETRAKIKARRTTPKGMAIPGDDLTKN